jgi:hypothetical protein
MKTLNLLLILIILFSTNSFADQVYSDFAIELIGCNGDFGSAPYDNPCSVLGKPATNCKNMPGSWGLNNFRVKLVEAAYNIDLENKKVITTINPGEYIVVKFDHKVVDYPGNLYGKDFIVFGNSFFTGSGVYIDDNANMGQFTISDLKASSTGEIKVSVSQDGQTWYAFDSGPFSDYLFPTQAYRWDQEIYSTTGNGWSDEEMDFTRPLDPNLTVSDFASHSVAYGINLYDGSAGGTSYDLEDLAGYDSLAIDSDSGYRWIQYVKFDGHDYGGQIDAVSDVAACGDPTHPYPVGDINNDCSVNLIDFALMSQNWLKCTYDCN